MTEDYKTTTGAPPDWRGLCAELTEHLALLDEPPHELVCRAQEALAQPEPEVVGPTDEELLRMAAEAIDPYDTIGIGEYEAETECAVEAYGSELIAFARAVLARFGHQPAPPAGELLKEAAWLRNECSAENADGNWISMSIDQALDLASLLERQAAPVPVAVSERPWEREGWCDDEDRCWCMSSLDGPPPRWWLVRPEPLSDGWVLPAHALPLPSGKVQP